MFEKVIQNPIVIIAVPIRGFKNIIRKIIEIGKLSHKNIVLEIGAGTGNLTKEILLANPKKIILIEKDEKLAAKLKKKFENYKNQLFSFKMDLFNITNT